MGIVDTAKEWLFNVALKKGIKAAVTVIVTAITSIKLAPILASLGITIDPQELTVGLTALLSGLLTMILNWVKLKTGVKWL